MEAFASQLTDLTAAGYKLAEVDCRALRGVLDELILANKQCPIREPLRILDAVGRTFQSKRFLRNMSSTKANWIKEPPAKVTGGVLAFLPISEITRGHIKQVSEKLSVDQEVKAKIIRTDWERERVSISTKELEADPWDTVADRYTEGKKVDGVIARVADFGVFVNLEEAIDGLVHISELDVDANTNLKKKFNVGDKMSVVVKSVDAKNRRISLTTTTSLEQDKTTAKYMSSQNDDGDTYNPFAALLKK